MNALTSSVLLNGLPLQRLPTSILESDLYICRQVFGGPRTNFEVTNSKNGILKTARPVGPRKWFYSFFFRPASTLTTNDSVESRLIVREHCTDSSDEFELLDANSTRSSDLPLRLLKMHSHWICRSNGLLCCAPYCIQKLGPTTF